MVTYIPALTYLRSLAVVLVLVDHSHLIDAAGHLGVDIFFVLSGYVITRSLLTSDYSTCIDYRNFIMRRSARLLPALFATLVITLCMLSVTLPQSQWSRLLESSVWTLLSLSNFYFWQNVGYFDGLAELKPLIHTWSLGIEWQFYFLLGAFFVVSRIHRAQLLLLSFACTLSLGVMFYFEKDSPVATFYLLPPRAWQLMFGVLLALAERGSRQHSSSKRYNLWFFLVAVVLTTWCLTPISSLFSESINRLAVSILTTFAIFIAIKSKIGTPDGGFFSLKRFCYSLGLWSYSIYLIHQPLLAALKIEIQQTNNYTLNFLTVCISIFLGFILYTLVENNRLLKKVFGSPSGVLSALGLFVLVIFGLLALQSFEPLSKVTYSAEKRQQLKVTAESWGQDLYSAMVDDGECVFSVRVPAALDDERVDVCTALYGSPTIIIGDSHAVNVFNVIAHASREVQDPFIIGVVRGGCRIHDFDGCHYEELREYFTKFPAGVDKLIYHQSGSYLLRDFSGQVDGEYLYLPEYQNAEFSVADDNIEKIYAYLKGIKANETLWLGPFREIRIDIEREVERGGSLAVRHRDVLYGGAIDEVAHRLKPANVEYIPFDNFINVSAIPVFVETCLVWRDPDHFSNCGERFLSSVADWTTLKGK